MRVAKCVGAEFLMHGELLDAVRPELGLPIVGDHLERLGGTEIVFHVGEHRWMSKHDDPKATEPGELLTHVFILFSTT